MLFPIISILLGLHLFDVSKLRTFREMICNDGEVKAKEPSSSIGSQ